MPSITSYFATLLGMSTQSPAARLAALHIASTVQNTGPAAMYRLLKSYYFSNGLYDALTQSIRELGQAGEALKPLRNPTYRTVEFYVSHIWPGTLPNALPILTDNDTLAPAVEQLWQWSNWGNRKQVAVRQLAMTGDLFVKLVQTEDRKQVYLQLIDAEYVTAFTEDHRDYLTMIRIDTPQYNDRGLPYTHVEVWSKEKGTRRIWLTERGCEVPLAELGNPQDEVPMSDFGIDFVPFVHTKFRDVGDDRGMAAIVPAIDKIDEANRQATRLHQMLFRYSRPLWAITGAGNDDSGRPMPVPALSNGESITINEDTLIGIPGTATLQSLVPNIDYEAALEILQDHMSELENDLPELAYYSIRQIGNPSGRALRVLLSDAIDKLMEARGNAEDGMIRAHKMGLTMMAANKLAGVKGSYENGDFDHSFEERNAIPIDALEEAQTELAQAQAVQAWVTAGLPLADALMRTGCYSEKDITAILERKASEADPAADPTDPNYDPGVGEVIPTGAR